MELYYEVFDKLKEENASVIDQHNFIHKIGGNNPDHNAYRKALNKLAHKRFIRIDNISRKQIVLAPAFYDAVEEGGIDAYEKRKREEKELNEELIRSSIRTNKISKRISYITTTVAIVTLIVLLYDTFKKDSNDSLKNDKYIQDKEIIIEQNETDSIAPKKIDSIN